MSLSSILSPVVTFVKESALKLSTLDGKPGLSASDFEHIAETAADVSNAAVFNGGAAHETVSEWLKNSKYGKKIPQWTVQIIVWLAYNWAKRKGLVAK